MSISVDIINTGSELLLGRTLNRHAAYLGGHLFRAGFDVRRQVTVPDGEGIADELRRSFEESDLVLVTGGLGPTSDDLTRESAAGVLGLKMLQDEGVVAEIRDRLERRGKRMGEEQFRQAMVPEGAVVLANRLGTAPGLYLPAEILRGYRCRALFLLPGPPRELHPLFEDQVLAILKEQFAGLTHPRYMREVRFAGIGESDLAAKVDYLLADIENLEIGYCAHTGEVELRLIGEQDLVVGAMEKVRNALFERIVGEGDGASMEGAIVRLLLERGETVATVESCTGGSLASRLTDVPGCSAVFGWGAVTYANAVKTSIAGVAVELLEANGAVSAEVATAMAEGALMRSGADYALSTTGIAGPDGGSEEKPVGTVYIALAALGEETEVSRHHFDVDRMGFKISVTTAALEMLRRRLCGESVTG